MTAEQKCPFHTDHENRIKNLEITMKENKVLAEEAVEEVTEEVQEVKKAQVNPAIWLGAFTLIGTCVTATGSFIGVIAVAYAKSKGYIP